MTNLLDPEQRLVVIPPTYPHPFDAKKAALEAASKIAIGTVEELLEDANVILAWLDPQPVILRYTTPEPQNGATSEPAPAEGTDVPPGG